MEALFYLTLGGSVLTLLLLALRYLVLKKMSSTVYYYAWLLVLLRFALPLPGLIPTASEVKTSDTTVYVETNTADHSQSKAGLSTPADGSGALPAAFPEPQTHTQAAEAPESMEPASISNTVFSLNWHSPEFWISIWAIGTAFSLGLTIFAYLRFISRLKREIHRPDRHICELYASVPGHKPALFCSDTVRTPMMFGVFLPKIVLPERSYDEDLLRNILRHELMHYRRFDTLYKWGAVAVLSAHWFNPLSWLIRKELNRACELSCDELLLRSMTRGEKQSYGNTLLSMAATSALPAGVVATTFATEKRNLKERLEQIMHYKKSKAKRLTAALALVLLAGFALAAGPRAMAAETAEILPDETGEAIRVATVDEFLTAIAPNTVIELAPGEYDLSTASNYGKDTHSSYYSWNGVWSEDNAINAELVIQNVEGLTLRGAGLDNTMIAAVPRYANVIRFVGCRDLTVSNLTAGHTAEPGFCTGGVLCLENCTDTQIDTCGLYGCGTVGVDAFDTVGLNVTGCHIYECSYNAVSVRQCRSVSVEGCEIYRHGNREGQGSAIALFTAAYSDNVVIHNNRVHDNISQFLLQLNYTKNAAFLSNEILNNRFEAGVFQFEQYGATVDGCVFQNNNQNNGAVRNWVYSSGVYANDVTGKLLDASDFESMSFRKIDPDIAVIPVQVSAAAEVTPGGSIEVTSVDEFLAAIGPERTIILNTELMDLSSATNYGSVGGEYYFWNQCYDGPELVIQNVNGLSIQAKASDSKATTLAAIPRYANVLAFRNCDDLHLVGFTAGHTKEPGSCSGGVLDFQNCSNVEIHSMRLYGCGILGIQASNCSTLSILRTEIYECSQGAAQFFQTDGIVFDSCDIHDVPSPSLTFNKCGDKSWNSQPIPALNGIYDLDENHNLVELENRREEVFTGKIDNLANPFANEPAHHYQAGTPQALFAESVQKAIADGDWERLADRIGYPVQIFTPEYSFYFWTKEEFMDSVSNDNFMQISFNDDYRKRIAAADILEFGDCVFGETICDHLIAFSCFGGEVTEDNLFVTAISLSTPLYPGRAYAEAVPPTPQL